MDDLISRQEAIDALIDRFADEDSPCIEYMVYWDHGMVIDTLKKVPTAQQWIPCSERMPEEDNETGNGVQYSNAVLITVFNKKDEETIIDFAHTANGTWYSYVSDCSIPHGWKVLAWMPLPEPYGKRRTDDVDVNT